MKAEILTPKNREASADDDDEGSTAQEDADDDTRPNDADDDGDADDVHKSLADITSSFMNGHDSGSTKGGRAQNEIGALMQHADAMLQHDKAEVLPLQPLPIASWFQ